MLMNDDVRKIFSGWRKVRPNHTHLFLQNVFILFLTLVFLVIPGGVSSARGENLTADDILNKVDDLYRGTSSHGMMTMEVVTAHWSRTLSLEFWSKGKDKSLIRILAPLKEKGTATLRAGNEIWNYLPKVNRVIKLPSSMMSASWMGSHFTNDDLVKESRFTDDYKCQITFQGPRKGENIIELSCIPKPDAPVVWGKVEIVVRHSDYLPIVMHYYDEKLRPARDMTFSQFKKMSGRTLPAVLTLVPIDKPREKTIVVYDKITFDLSLNDDVFSIRNLQR